MTLSSIVDHLITVAAILIPLGIAWHSNRRENLRMHQENQNRLIAIETKLEPLWKWWINSNS